ncbi:MAG: hypothetical protein AAB739_00910 [Patescibacteria group bacterium]
MKNTIETDLQGDVRKRRGADVSEFAEEVVLAPEKTEEIRARKAGMVEKLKQLGAYTNADGGIAETKNLARGGERFSAEVAEMEGDIAEYRMARYVAKYRTKITNDAKYLERTRSFINKIVVFVCFAGGVGAIVNYVDSLDKEQKKREKAACELLQKGQPLPNAPSEVQLPAGNSLYELVDECEITHGVDITYGCAAEGLLRTAGLHHEPSEISEDIRAEAARVARDVKCDQ